MTMANKDPLAPGVYWIDLFPEGKGPGGVPQDGEQIFDAWAATPPGAVTTISKQRGAEANVRLFTVFEVHAAPAPSPMPFPRPQLGSPTIQKLASAPGGITPADVNVQDKDTAKAPEPGGLGDWFGELGEKVKEAAKAVAPELIIGGIALWVVLEQQKGNRR
jgi:hypothetical protein